jgi:hypothetical protein
VTNKLNPDSVILQQVDGQWQKLAMLILWKCVGAGKVVRVTADDIERLNKTFAPGIPVIFTHGHSDSIDFSIVTEQRAQQIGEHDKAMRESGGKTPH